MVDPERMARARRKASAQVKAFFTGLAERCAASDPDGRRAASRNHALAPLACTHNASRRWSRESGRWLACAVAIAAVFCSDQVKTNGTWPACPPIARVPTCTPSFPAHPVPPGSRNKTARSRRARCSNRLVPRVRHRAKCRIWHAEAPCWRDRHCSPCRRARLGC